MAKHDLKMVANVPGDEYYREQIRTLQRKLDDLQTRTEMQGEYIATLEKDNLRLLERVETLRSKLADMIEGKYV